MIISKLSKVPMKVEAVSQWLERLRAKQEVRVSIPGAAKEFGSFFPLSTSTSVHQAV